MKFSAIWELLHCFTKPIRLRKSTTPSDKLNQLVKWETKVFEKKSHPLPTLILDIYHVIENWKYQISNDYTYIFLIRHSKKRVNSANKVIDLKKVSNYDLNCYNRVCMKSENPSKIISDWIWNIFAIEPKCLKLRINRFTRWILNCKHLSFECQARMF